MKIIIDTENETITVPYDFKKAFDLIGNKKNNILSMINIDNYKLKVIMPNINADRLTAKDIDTYMNSIKETNKAKYEEYVQYKDQIVGKTSNGKPKKISFLLVKKWFYENFPDQKPKTKKTSK